MKIRAIQRILIFNNNCILTAREKIIIGDRTIFGPGVAIFDNDHAYKEKNFEEIRRETSIVLHKALLESERFFYQHNIPMAISFIGGSCKLCKDGCGKDRCNNPYMARSPLESIGVNVVTSALNKGKEIKFHQG